MHILGVYVQDMKFLWSSNLWLGGLSTDDSVNNNNDDYNAGRQHMMDSGIYAKWTKNYCSTDRSAILFITILISQ